MGLIKATIVNEDTKAVITCLFNPTEYTVAKTNSWEAKKVVGKNVPPLVFTGGGSSTMSMQLFFDVNEWQYDSAGGGAPTQPQRDGVREYIAELWKLVLIDEGKKNASTKRSRPPLCTFQWGQNWWFKAAITSLTVRYTLFREDGVPVRATADVTFQEAEDDTEQKLTNPTSHSEEGYKRREVRPMDTLASIATEEYGSPNKWRRIADANGLEDPLGLRPGQLLAIPPQS